MACVGGGQHNTGSNTTLLHNGTINIIHGYFGTVNAITLCGSRMIGFTATSVPFLQGELSASTTPQCSLARWLGYPPHNTLENINLEDRMWTIIINTSTSRNRVDRVREGRS